MLLAIPCIFSVRMRGDCITRRMPERGRWRSAAAQPYVHVKAYA